MKKTPFVLIAAAAILSLAACGKTNDPIFDAKVRAYLLEHPEVIEEAMVKLQEKRDSQAVAEARFFYGYKPYVDRLDLRPDQRAIASDNREELARAKEAIEKAMEGHSVAVVSGGDPGVFAMAAAVRNALG